MKNIKITGASQRVNENAGGLWQAVYECHKCGEEFASSSYLHKTEKEARDESDTLFDKQQRRFCYRCGYKLSTSEPLPENDCIANLNYRIDELEQKNRELVEKNKILKDTLNGMSDAERIAISKGWIKAVEIPSDEEIENYSPVQETLDFGETV